MRKTRVLGILVLVPLFLVQAAVEGAVHEKKEITKKEGVVLLDTGKEGAYVKEGAPQESQRLRYVPGEIIVKFKSQKALESEAGTLKQKGEKKSFEKIVPRITESLKAQIHQREDLKIQGNSINAISDLPVKVKSLIKDKTILEPVFKGLHRKMQQEKKTEIQINTEIFNKLSQKRNMPQKEPKNYNLSNVYILRGIDTKGKSIEELCQELQQDPNVEYSEPNYIAMTLYVPDDPLYSEQWAHQKTQAEQGWDITRGDANIIIAIVDTGVDYNHEDLLPNIWRDADDRPGKDFVDIDVELYQSYGVVLLPGEDYTDIDDDPMDFNGHGTHCAGIVAAVGNNSIGVAGVAHNCKIMPARAGFSAIWGGQEYGFIDDVAAANAIKYATDNGADVISMSFGGPESQMVKDNIDIAHNQGVVLVAAAGNNGSFEESFPAAYDNVIAVAATANDDTLAEYSNYGSWVDIAAPGGDKNKDTMILSTVPEEGGAICDRTGYRALQGTSMACPYVAGTIALLKSVHPDWTSGFLTAQLFNTVNEVKIVPSRPNQELFTAGRVNVNNALNMTPQPRLVISDIRISDSGRDGQPNPNETVTAYITLKNKWLLAQGVTAILQTEDSYINIITAPADYGDIDSGSSVTRPFSFYISPSAPEPHDISFTLSMSMLNGKSDTQNFSILIPKNNICEPKDYGWVVTMGGINYDRSNGVAYDSKGNMYVVGQFSDNFDFDPTSGRDFLPFAGGSWDIFITKLNADNSYGWTKRIGGQGAEAGRAVTIDPKGNILVAGEFCGPDFSAGYNLDFNPGEGVDIHTTSGRTDVFITKFNADGSYAWTRTIGGPSYEMPLDIATDREGNVLITGVFMGTVDFDPTDGVDYHTAGGPEGDAFITKLYADGSYAWTHTFGGPAYDEGKGIVADTEGNVWVTGYYGSDFVVEGWGSIPYHGGEDAFIAKLNPSGDYLQFYTIGGPHNDDGMDIALDSNNNVVVAGCFSDTVDLDPTVGADIKTSTGGFNVFVMKINSSENYVWGCTFGGTGDDWDWAKNVGVDANGNVFVAGLFEGTVDFDSGSGVDYHSSNGSEDIFVTKFDSMGNYKWTYTFGGIVWDEVCGIDIDTKGNPVTVGQFQSTVDFDPTSAVDNRVAEGWTDIFILKLTPLQIHLPFATTTINEGQSLSFTVTASDKNGEQLNLEAIDSPQGASFTQGTTVILPDKTSTIQGKFTWTPTYEQAGVYQVTFKVSDGQLGDSETVTITVNNVNRAPTVGSFGPSTSGGVFQVDKVYLFGTRFSDADGYNDLKELSLVIRSTANPSLSLMALYKLKENKLYLHNGTTYIGGFSPGSSNVIDAPYGKLYCAQTTVSGSGTNLTLNWYLSFKTTLKGTASVSLSATDTQSASSGLLTKGNITIYIPLTQILDRRDINADGKVDLADVTALEDALYRNIKPLIFDYDRNGKVDSQDISAHWQYITDKSTNPNYDVNWDSYVNTNDYSALCYYIYNNRLPLRFDYSGNGVVDAEDVNKLKSSLSVFDRRDINADGKVDLADVTALEDALYRNIKPAIFDYDRNGTVNSNDVSMLYSQVTAKSTNSNYDVNWDSYVNTTDYSALCYYIYNNRLPLRFDYSGNGVVDAEDVNKLKGSL